MIPTIISITLLTLGALLMLAASIGIVRMPDVFLRMSASTKATTLGVMLIMGGVAIHFQNLGVTARTVGVIIFIMLTGPVSAHMIARAAYITGTPIWSGTKIDELKGHYDLETHRLESNGSQQSSIRDNLNK